jgi:hypothetical protein
MRSYYEVLIQNIQDYIASVLIEKSTLDIVIVMVFRLFYLRAFSESCGEVLYETVTTRMKKS